jgi:immunoglobulin-binding protein 1
LTNVALQAQQKRRGIANGSNGPKDYDLITGLLPSKEAEAEDEEDLRELFASVLRLFYTEAQKHISNAVREMELLRSAPPRSPVKYSSQDPRPSTSSDETWKLDTPLPLGGLDGKGPLLDQQGKVRKEGLLGRAPHDYLTAPSPLHNPPIWGNG